MNRIRARLRDERGLLGKIVVLWFVLFALFVVAAIDTGAILINRFQVENAAESAAFEAATALKASQDAREARDTALATIEREASGARMTEFAIDPKSGEVTVTVAKRSWTLLAGRLPWTKHLARSTATDTSGPPTL